MRLGSLAKGSDLARVFPQIDRKVIDRRAVILT